MLLRLLVTDMVKSYILNVSDPTVAGEVLAKVYSRQTIANVLNFLDRLENIKMSEDMSVSTFMQHVNDLLNDLREINKLPSDIMVVHKILKNLLTKYENFVKILRAKKETPSLIRLVSRLHMEELEMSMRTRSTQEVLIFKIRNIMREKQRPFNGHKAFSTMNNINQRRIVSQQRFMGLGERHEGLVCYRCGKPG